tara:strand:+ start:5085 stop:5192 length:108 start_codon:yes stop_codon:yes gene_type:complete
MANLALIPLLLSTSEWLKLKPEVKQLINKIILRDA